MRLTFCKGDVIAIAFVFLLALLTGIFFLRQAKTTEDKILVIYQDGKKCRELPLSEDTEVVIQGAYTNRIVVRDGKAAIIESDCPGRDCVYSGWMEEGGKTIVCLPNRVLLQIEESEQTVDFIVR